MCAYQCHQPTKPREEGTGSYIHVCPSLSVTAPVYLLLLLAVIASGIGHYHTARASSRLTSHGCTSCKKSRKHHGPIACFTPRRALIGTRFPTLLLSGCDQAAAAIDMLHAGVVDVSRLLLLLQRVCPRDHTRSSRRTPTNRRLASSSFSLITASYHHVHIDPPQVFLEVAQPLYFVRMSAGFSEPATFAATACCSQSHLTSM